MDFREYTLLCDGSFRYRDRLGVGERRLGQRDYASTSASMRMVA